MLFRNNRLLQAGTYFQICIFSLLINYYCGVSHTEAALPFGASVFPLLTSGWYPKPGPKEALLLGVMLVNILALKFAASAAGVPYHLNDIKLDHFFDKKYLYRRGKRSSSLLEQRLSKRDLVQESLRTEAPEEFAALERVLLALRRIDGQDCFIRYVCQVNQDLLYVRQSQNGSSSSEQATFSDFAFANAWIDIFRLRPKLNYSDSSTWSIYDEALKPEPMDCNKKYAQCPLTEQDLSKANLLSTLF